MKARLTLMAAVGMVGVVSMILQAATGPGWWIARGVLNTNLPPNDFALVNQGQLKWMALNAALELESTLPGGAGSNVWALISSFTDSNNFRAVNLGQLKFVAQPFYDRLMAVGYTNAYPWSGQPNDFALANIGQMKNVFSFDPAWWMTLDSDEDGMPDWWEILNGLDPSRDDDEEDPDGDGSTNGQEYAAATNPHDSNSMPADNPVKRALDEFPYAQLNLVRAVVGLPPVQWMFSTNNETRILQLREAITEAIPRYVPGALIEADQTGPLENWTVEALLAVVLNRDSWPGTTPLTPSHVEDISRVLGELHTVGHEGQTIYEGHPLVEIPPPEDPTNFVTRVVICPYPENWPTAWTKSTWIHFRQMTNGFSAGNCIEVNERRFSGMQCYAGEDITEGWRANTVNSIEGWYNGGIPPPEWDFIYLAPFTICHFLHVPWVEVKFTGDIFGGFDDWTEFQPGGDMRIWLSVPQGGANTLTASVSGVALSRITFDTDDPNIATVSPSSPTSPSQVLTVTGTSTGNSIQDTLVNVKVDGIKISSFHVDVLPPATVTCAPFDVASTGKPATTPVNSASVADLSAFFDETFGRQANVWFAFTNKVARTAPYDDYRPNDVLNVEDVTLLLQVNNYIFSVEEDIIQKSAISTAQTRVFFVHRVCVCLDLSWGASVKSWPILELAGRSPWGSRTCFVADVHLGTPSYVACHEMGHGLGELNNTVDSRDRLMYAYDQGSSPRRLVRHEWRQFNERARTP